LISKYTNPPEPSKLREYPIMPGQTGCGLRSPVASVIAYIDGFNLYHGLRDRFGHRYLWLDLVRLVTRLRPNDSLVAVKYFTAAVRNDPPAQARQREYLEALDAHSGPLLRIVRGRYQAKNVSCHRCGSTWISYEEKETDVNIAVSLVADAALGATDIALLISADSDLCPAIRTARAVAPTLGMIAVFPPRRNSFEIKTLIPSAFQLAQVDIRNSLLPTIVTDRASGAMYQRPTKWY
jgi:hypothetical protein